MSDHVYSIIDNTANLRKNDYKLRSDWSKNSLLNTQVDKQNEMSAALYISNTYLWARRKMEANRDSWKPIVTHGS